MSVVQCAEGNTQLRDEAALLINTGEPCVPGWLVDTRSAWHWEKTDTSCGLGLVAFLVDQNRSPKSCFEAQGCYHNSIFIGYPDSICDSGPK